MCCFQIFLKNELKSVIQTAIDTYVKGKEDVFVDVDPVDLV
ncbi:hypothetical protein ACFL6H_03555 [Candidatus Latescibacterota bacterium]